MAQIIEKNIYSIDNNTATWTLFNELENAFEWQSVTGTDDAKLFRINSNLAIRFDTFETARAAGSSSSFGRIYAVIRNTDVHLGNLQGNMMTTDRKFRIIIGAAGDIAFQLGFASGDKTPTAGCGLRFAVVNVLNTNTKNTGYGVYAPKTVGIFGSTYPDAVPLFMYTDDTVEPIPNTGFAGLNNNASAKITALMPIVCVSSACVSTSAYIPLISSPDIQQGYIEMDDVLYYTIGGLCFVENSEEV